MIAAVVTEELVVAVVVARMNSMLAEARESCKDNSRVAMYFGNRVRAGEVGAKVVSGSVPGTDFASNFVEEPAVAIEAVTAEEVGEGMAVDADMTAMY
jgi:hypothetical protein